MAVFWGTFLLTLLMNCYAIHGHYINQQKMPREEPWRDNLPIAGYTIFNIGLIFYLILNPFEFKDFLKYYQFKINLEILNIHFKLKIYSLVIAYVLIIGILFVKIPAMVTSYAYLKTALLSAIFQFCNKETRGM